MIDISIVIVSWNAKEYLCNCLESIRKTKANLSVEVIVVDNDSSDGSPEEVQSHYPGVRLIQTGENLGFAKANNIGINHCSGRYVCLVNSDVVVLDNCFQGLTAWMDENYQAGIAGPKILNSDMTFQPSARHLPSLMGDFGQAFFLDRLPFLGFLFYRSNMKEHELRTLRKVPGLSGCFWIVRRKALEEVGGLDEDFFMYAEDNDWCKRFTEAGWDVVYIPQSEAIHYGGASSSNSPSKFYVEMKKSNMLYYMKHHGMLACKLAAVIALLHSAIRWLGWKFISHAFPNRRESAFLKIERYALCIRWLLRKRAQ